MTTKRKRYPVYNWHVVMPENDWKESPLYKKGVRTYCVAVRSERFVNSYKIVGDKMTEIEAHKMARQLDNHYTV